MNQVAWDLEDEWTGFGQRKDRMSDVKGCGQDEEKGVAQGQLGDECSSRSGHFGAGAGARRRQRLGQRLGQRQQRWVLYPVGQVHGIPYAGAWAKEQWI